MARQVQTLFPQVNAVNSQSTTSANTNITVDTTDNTRVVVADNTLEDNTSVGDFVEINGVEYTVTALDPMTGEVTLSSNDGTNQTANVAALPTMVDISFENIQEAFAGNITDASGELGLNMTTGETITFTNNDAGATTTTGPLYHLENGATDYVIVNYHDIPNAPLPRRTTQIVTMTLMEYETLFPTPGMGGRQPDPNTLYLLTEDAITT